MLQQLSGPGIKACPKDRQQARVHSDAFSFELNVREGDLHRSYLTDCTGGTQHALLGRHLD